MARGEGRIRRARRRADHAVRGAGLGAGGLAVVAALALVSSWLDRGSVAPGRMASLPGAARPALAGMALPGPVAERPLPAPAMTVATGGAHALAPERPTGRFGPVVPREGLTAELAVKVTRDGEPAPCTVTVLAGPNRGVAFTVAGPMVHAAGAERPGGPLPAGAEPVPLYPGYARVEVALASGERCVRDLELRHRRPTPLVLDFGDQGLVQGIVMDADGEPVAGAQVELDGESTRTGHDGRFAAPRRASGGPQLIVRHAGHASWSRRLPATSGQGGDGPLAIRLDRGRAVSVSVVGAVVPGEVVLYFLPSQGPWVVGPDGLSGYPWHDVNPVPVPVGGQVVLEDLPAGRFDLAAFGPRSRSEPTHAWLADAGRPEVRVRMAPLPTLEGHVTRAGEPVAGAAAALVIANPFAATQKALGALAHHYRSQPVELLPHLVARARTDDDGRFRLARGGKGAHVTVTELGGTLSVTQVVAQGDVALSWDLAHPGD